MGLFDKVLGTGSEKLSEADAFCGVCLCAIASDGVISQEEATGLGTVLTRMKLYRGKSPRDMNALFDKVVKVIRTKGADELLKQSAEALTPELRPTAFAVAADLLMSDGYVEAEEKVFLEKIQKALGVEDATAVKIVEVLAIKNRG